MNLDARLPRWPLLSAILLLVSLLGGRNCLADTFKYQSHTIFTSPNGERQLLLEPRPGGEQGGGLGITGTLFTISREKGPLAVSPRYNPVWSANFPQVYSRGAFVADSGNYVVLIESFAEKYADALLRIVNAKGKIERTLTFGDFYSPEEFAAMPKSAVKWWFWDGHMEPGKDVVILELWAEGNTEEGMKFKNVSVNLATGQMKEVPVD